MRALGHISDIIMKFRSDSGTMHCYVNVEDDAMLQPWTESFEMWNPIGPRYSKPSLHLTIFPTTLWAHLTNDRSMLHMIVTCTSLIQMCPKFRSTSVCGLWFYLFFYFMSLCSKDAVQATNSSCGLPLQGQDADDHVSENSNGASRCIHNSSLEN